MGSVLKRRYDKSDTDQAILGAILKLSTDRLGRVLVHDHCDWLEQKMREIARLTRILRKRSKGQ